VDACGAKQQKQQIPKKTTTKKRKQKNERKEKINIVIKISVRNNGQNYPIISFRIRAEEAGVYTHQLPPRIPATIQKRLTTKKAHHATPHHTAPGQKTAYEQAAMKKCIIFLITTFSPLQSCKLAASAA
jgi:hypothetical protein